MCVVCHAVFVGPLLHAFGYLVGYRAVELGTVVDNVDELFVDVGRKILIHLLAVEHFLPKVFGRALCGSDYFYRLLFGSFGYCLKS